MRSDGFSARYWEYLVDLLASWRAIRPLTKVEIRSRGSAKLAEIEKEYWRTLSVHDNSEPDLSTAKWYELNDLFSIASSIKGVYSPVFPSKLCHFILPNFFPVIDNKFIGLNHSYETYWKNCQNAWIACNEKEKLKQLLLVEIGEPVVPTFPWSTKITEICFAAL